MAARTEAALLSPLLHLTDQTWDEIAYIQRNVLANSC